MPELKPCPFCGGKAILRSEPYDDVLERVWYEIYCSNCEAAVPTYIDESQVVESWNERHSS